MSGRFRATSGTTRRKGSHPNLESSEERPSVAHCVTRSDVEQGIRLLFLLGVA